VDDVSDEILLQQLHQETGGPFWEDIAEQEQLEMEMEMEQDQDQVRDVPPPLVTDNKVESREEGEVSVWQKELDVLREMGFEDQAVLLPLLRTHVPVPASLREVEEGGRGAAGAGAGAGGRGGAGQQQEGLQAVVWALLAGP
jgi:hypothetical protein